MASITTDQEITAAEPQSTDPEVLNEHKSVKDLINQYKAARTFDIHARNGYVSDRRVASGRLGKAWASSANLIGTFIDILVSFLYAKDPDVTALPAPVVGDTSKDAVDFAATITIIVSKLWKKARLKKAARKMVRSSLSVGPGWLKVIMTHETKRDPEVEVKLNDLEDNLLRLQFAETELQEDELDADQREVKIRDMELLQESLRAKLEVAHRFGLAIDFVQADDMQVSMDVSDLSDYLDADWNSNEIYIRTDEIRTKFPRLTLEDAAQAASFHQRKTEQLDTSSAEEPHGVDIRHQSHQVHGRFHRAEAGGTGDEVTFARVIELWDNRDNHIKTMIDGIGRWAIEPYPPPYASSRFYPYFLLSLFEVDGERHPQSLSDRLKKLQDEYSSKRSNSRLATERSIPATLFDAQGISPTDVKKIEAGVAQELIGLSPTKGDDLRKLFAAKPVAEIDPRVYDTGPVLRDMERVGGVQEALSQSISVEKTATEAKIQDTGFASRTGADRDSLEDVLLDMAEYTTELALQAIPVEEAQRMAGLKAFWPKEMPFEDIVTLVELDIEAGSTGKPNQESLRSAWSVLLPLVTSIMTQIQQAQLQGNVPMAEALTNVLRETMRRLDERINIDQFIPQGDLPNLLGAPELPGADGAPNGAGTPPGSAADANTLV